MSTSPSDENPGIHNQARTFTLGKVFRRKSKNDGEPTLPSLKRHVEMGKSDRLDRRSRLSEYKGGTALA